MSSVNTSLNVKCNETLKLKYGTDLIQVCACARVCSRVLALASCFEHTSASFEYKYVLSTLQANGLN